MTGWKRGIVRRRNERFRLRVPDVRTLDVEEILQPPCGQVGDRDGEHGEDDDGGAAPDEGQHEGDRDPEEP